VLLVAVYVVNVVSASNIPLFYDSTFSSVTYNISLTASLDVLHVSNCVNQRFSNFFQVGTTFISQNVLWTTLLLGLSNSLGLP